MLNKEKLEIGNRKFTSQNGISLIALIIIVLLILAGAMIGAFCLIKR